MKLLIPTKIKDPNLSKKFVEGGRFFPGGWCRPGDPPLPPLLITPPSPSHPERMRLGVKIHPPSKSVKESAFA